MNNNNNNNNNILVYDTSKCYARFVKINLSKDYTITTYTDSKSIKEANLDEYNVAIVIANSHEDLANFLLIFSKVNNVFYGSTLKDINVIVTRIDEITFLDLEMNKNDLIKTIHLNLKYLMMLDEL